MAPLFARHASVWLRVWAVTQLAASVTATSLAVDRAGSLHATFAGSSGMRLGVALIALVIWHVAGFRLYDWLLREGWRSVLFTVGALVLIYWASFLRREYALLVLGALLQTCVFLSFPWIAAALVTFVGVNAILITRGRGGISNASPLSSVPILVLGVIVGTVVLYIHRSNRDAAVQDDLLRRLDAAQQDLAARSREAGVLEERQRLSRDLHDTLAQGFTSVIAQLSAAQLVMHGSRDGRDVAADTDRVALAAPYLERAQMVSRASLTEIRRLVLALRPTELADGPLPAALERVVREWSSLNGIAASFEAQDVPELLQEAEVTLLRATQEGLGNVARHASAREVRVRLSCVDDLVLLEIDDDGVGIAEQPASEGRKLGLAGMRERVAALGGRVMLESSASAGTSITVALPLATVAATTRTEEA